MLSDKQLENIRHVHFIGIGGSGMYPLVQILHSRGYFITGSDNNETDTLKAVRSMGIQVFMGQRAENIDGADLIVYTVAIMDDNPELIAARNSGALLVERAELLGLVTREYLNAVCVCGTHGKTTATSMLTQIFMEEGVDVSCVIGGKLPSIGGSGRCGKSDILVCEACEFKDHFLMLAPDISVILNVDADHLEYFGNIENIIASFRKFAQMTSKALIVNGGDENTMTAIKGIDKETITFGFDISCDYSAKIKEKKGLRTTFTLYYKGEEVRDMTIFVPGDHNVLNALAAIAAARYLDVSYDGIEMGLQAFRGAVRRFQQIAEVDGVTVVDDYGHHPKEIKCTLAAAKQLGFNRVWALFQPFTYSRTSLLLDDFADALSLADIAAITDIMGSREKNTFGIYAEDLAGKIENSVWFETPHAAADAQTEEQKIYNFGQITDYIADNCEKGDLVISFGCGDVYKAAVMLAEKLREKAERGRK